MGDSTDVPHDNPLIEAASIGDIPRLRSLLSSGVSTDTRDQGGFTALHHACGNGRVDAASHLILSGADVNARSWGDNVTPLYWACDSGFHDVATLLIENHADVDLGTSSQRTPLHTVCKRGFESLSELLVSSRANVNAKDEHGETPLLFAVNGGHSRVINLLVHVGGADVNLANGSGWAPIHSAAFWNQLEILSFLVQRGADPNAKDDHGHTPLHLTASVACVRWLLMNGADIHARTIDGQTALHAAVKRDSEEAFSALLEERAEVDAATKQHWTALHEAADIGSVTYVRMLLAHNAQVNLATSTGWTALHLAAGRGYDEVCSMLIDAGADVNAKSAEGYTALHWSARRGNDATAAYLIQAGAKVNAVTASGESPLHWATTKSMVSTMRLLLQAGADASIRNADGFTAADLPVADHVRDVINQMAAGAPGGDGLGGGIPHQGMSRHAGPISVAAAERELAARGTLSAEVAQELLAQIKELNVRLKNEEDVRRRAIRAMQERSARKTGVSASAAVSASSSSSATRTAAVTPRAGSRAGHARPPSAGANRRSNGDQEGQDVPRGLIDAAIQFVTTGLPRPLPPRDEDAAIDLILRKDEKVLVLYRNFNNDPAKFQRLLSNHLKSG